MKFTSIFQKLRLFGLLLMGILIAGTVYSQSDIKKEVKTARVTLRVTDDTGNPVPKVQVFVGDAEQYTETDTDGAVSFVAGVNESLSLVKPGYEKNVALVSDILSDGKLTLKKSTLFASSEDNVPLPFSSVKKRFATGSTQVINGTNLEKYPSNDLRNAFTGLATGVEVIESNGSPGLSAEERLGVYGITEKIGVTARGQRLMYIIDDIPIDITEMPLDPQEIESVTIIKDIVGKAMFGPAAADGVIYIKTKRGRDQEKKSLTFNFEEGVSVIDRFPQWVSGTDYATLNNQARSNSGLNQLYDESDMAGYARNDPYDMYHPNIDFRNMLLKDTKTFRRANFSSSGGGNGVKYAAYLGYNGEGDIFKLGPISDYNRLNARSNLDFRVNDLISVKVGLFGGLTSRRSANYGYATSEGTSEMDLVEFNSLIKDIRTTPAIAFPVYANNEANLDAPWYGVSAAYKNNPIARLTENGYYTETGRTGGSNVALEYDMKNIVPGLKSTTFVGVNMFNLNRIGKTERHIAYTVSPTTDVNGAPTLNLARVHDGVAATSFSNLHDYYTQRYVGYQNLNYSKSFNKHDIQSGLTYYMSKTLINGEEEPQRLQNTILAGSYAYNKRYMVQWAVNYAGSGSFSKENRYAMFPSIGLGWVISEEDFMKELKFVDYLKLRGEAGVLGYDDNLAPFNERDRWNRGTLSGFGPHNLNRWFGTNTGTLYNTSPARTGNPNLTWEKRKEFSVGIDALLLNQKLLLDVSYYNNQRDGQITRLPNSMPYLGGIPSNALPYYNNNQTRYYGLETGIRYTDSFGNFKISVGGNATIQNSKVEKFDEPNYRFEYQHRTGKPVDTYWGQTYLGKFQNDADAMAVPQLFDDELHQGDLKYKDMNGDGFVDDNDLSAIGHTTPRLFYALNTTLSYKNFDLTIIGTGRAFYDIPLTNEYFWNGWGDDNYSQFVMDNVGGAYPNMTYNKVNNNFLNSDYWLIKGGFFKIQNVELAYTLPANKSQVIGASGLRIFVRGANLVTVSKVKDVDPESIDSGVTAYPLFRTYTAGLKLNF